MRSFDQQIEAYLATRNKEPRFVIQVSYSTSSADDVYVVSHSGITFAGSPTVLAARVESVSVLSQQIFPDEGRATIGSMSFEALDLSASLTASQRNNLIAGRGLRYKLVKFWVGFKGQPFSAFALYATQMLSGVTYDQGVYTFAASDIQRSAKSSLFNRSTLRLASNIDATTTTIPITGNTALIQALEHDSAWSDAPSSTVAYVRIDDEIIRIPTAGIVANQFTGVTRGALGTVAAEHTTDTGSGTDKQKAVEEQIYLEMNAVKLAYAVLTGALFGQSGTMPGNCTAAIAGAYVDSPSFTNIGTDLYDGTAGGGIRLRFLNPKAGEAKRFVEQQICSIIGCFLFVKADGQLALRRLEEVLHAASPVGGVTDRELLAVPVLNYAYNRIQNQLQVRWNVVDEETTRLTSITDPTSIATWGPSELKVIEAQGLHGQIHSADALRALFQRYRSRYAGPPILTRVKCKLGAMRYEVGDIIQVATSHAVDHTDTTTTTGLLRSFEVQSTTVDWLDATVTLDLAGATMKASPLTRDNTGVRIADSWFTSGGTNIESLGHTSRVGSVVTWNSTGSFTGNASLAAAILRCDGDLVIGSGVRLDITQNVQLRVKGVLTVNGEIRGIGGGIAGVADTLNCSTWPLRTDATYLYDVPWAGVTQQLGTPAYYGSPMAGGGILERTRNPTGSQVNGSFQSFRPQPTVGKVDVVPTYLIGFDGSVVTGLPDDLRGSSGGPGGRRHYSNTTPGPDVIQDNNGGTGGAGGAGLLVVCRGMAFGASGKVDLSGAAGSVGAYNAGDEFPAHGGAGAGGAPGALVCVVDGVLNPIPALTSATVPARYGAVPLPGSAYNIMTDAFAVVGESAKYGQEIPVNRVSYFASSPTSSLLAGVAAARAMYLAAVTTPGIDGDDAALAGAQSITVALTQNPLGVDDLKQTRITATVTLVSVTAAYAFANIYARPAADSAPGVLVAQADNVGRFNLPADGQSWIVTAIPVLTNLTESPNRSNWATASITTVGAGSLSTVPRVEDFSDADLVRVQNRWGFVFEANGEQSIVAETGTPPPMGGQWVYQHGNNSGNDMNARGWVAELAKPIVKDALYKAIFVARRVAGTGTAYFGVNMFGADHATYISTEWCAETNINPGDTAWHIYTGYFKNTGAAASGPTPAPDPQTPKIVAPTGMFAGPMFYVNYNGAAGIWQIGWADIERVGAVLGETNTIATKHIDNEAVTAIAVASDALTDIKTTTDVAVVSVAIDAGAVVTDQDVLAIFSTEYDITWSDPPPHSGAQRNVGIVTSLYNSADAFVDSQTTNVYEAYGAATVVEGFGRYVSAAQTLTTTTGVGDVALFGGSISLSVYADAALSYASGEITTEDGSTYYEVDVSLTIQRTAGSNNQTVVGRLQYWTGSAWADVPGAIARAVSVGNTGGQWCQLVFKAWQPSTGGKFRVAVLPSAASAFDITDGTIILKRSKIVPETGGRVTGNVTTALVIPTASIVAGSNTVRIKAKIGSTTGIATANFNDSKLVAFLRKK